MQNTIQVLVCRALNLRGVKFCIQARTVYKDACMRTGVKAYVLAIKVSILPSTQSVLATLRSTTNYILGTAYFPPFYDTLQRSSSPSPEAH